MIRNQNKNPLSIEDMLRKLNGLPEQVPCKKNTHVFNNHFKTYIYTIQFFLAIVCTRQSSCLWFAGICYKTFFTSVNHIHQNDNRKENVTKTLGRSIKFITPPSCRFELYTNFHLIVDKFWNVMILICRQIHTVFIILLCNYYLFIYFYICLHIKVWGWHSSMLFRTYCTKHV